MKPGGQRCFHDRSFSQAYFCADAHYQALVGLQAWSRGAGPMAADLELATCDGGLMEGSIRGKDSSTPRPTQEHSTSIPLVKLGEELITGDVRRQSTWRPALWGRGFPQKIRREEREKARRKRSTEKTQGSET
ncbi:hypothetical protein PoB_004751900 [Plakobranchus ocellatus]|uniref:Uncharacterized protein n=1 Tax=Plakobranchus ocellatus TaxID=259542 RepID=A0AAV4BRN1_9GAST|nr:hypothetical protein PoB_004751900 [Plakobranchus ocellatus]